MTIATVAHERDLAHFDELPVELIDELPNAGDHPGAATRNGLGHSFDRIEAGIQGWLRHWEPQRLPAFTAVRDVMPDDDRGRSSLRAAPTEPDGAVRLTASLYDPPNRDGDPLAWSRNWASLAVLPPPRESGRLFYRFRVSSRLVLDGQAALSLASTSVNFGVVADTAKASPFQVPGFATPIARPLVGVQCREDQDATASQTFEGSIAVRQGETPAMAFVIGADLLFENGWVRVHEGSSTWIGPSEPGASGTIEFRYAPAAMLRLLGRLDEPHRQD
ncbi:hypothetical protein [Agromyces badenianii]|uniref:hypothetical protein n=1 Tax=Agromyces badenianii TaxID=2080742 RepID=UPI000D5903C2|nr:hypothetical protein [Agromyces badenianii]PWC04844.1 hypothetical protein DCE94_00355 [Agromyces badenianii]